MMNTKTAYTGAKAFVDEFLSGLEDREQEVLRSRYGLNGGEPETLQAIGNRYGITRERVRQIEAGALVNLRRKTDHPYLASFVEAASGRLKSVGGAEREDGFMENFARLTGHRGAVAEFASAAKFLLELSGKVLSFRDSYGNDWHDYWYLTAADKKQLQSFISKFESVMKGRKEEVLLGGKFDSVFDEVARTARMPQAAAKNYLAISKRFGVSPFGQTGLVSWSEVNPRTARDWAYLILKKEQKPLHFTELSKIIKDYRKGKRTNLQTVHNELIKDDRFVLVGRGMYGLKEHGYIPGTAKEIISHILKNNGPLRSREIISLVKEQRFFKEGTILINLQNRRNFQSLPDGRYTLREA